MSLSYDILKRIKKLSIETRVDVIKMINNGNSAHVGSALSIVDILTTIYSQWIPTLESTKDHKFILSKGHAGAALYSVLANLNFFKKSMLMTHCLDGSFMSGHVSSKIIGVEFSTGSLGQGLSVATGIALAAKISKNTKQKKKIFALLSDGELGEGSNWEAFLFASHHNLDNLFIIIDRNNLQSMTSTEKTLKLEPLNKKFISFGFEVVEIDGHNHSEIYSAIAQKVQNGIPRVIIAKTIKGKGVSYMENSVDWHYRTPKGDLYKAALEELYSDKTL